MRHLYDKLLLLVAVLILTAGCYFYVSAVDRALIGSSKEQQSVPYHQLKVAIEPPSAVNWSAPKEQSTGWIYDVFTPPKIYLDENGQFVNEGWKIYEPIPFGVKLIKLEKIPYRIQLEGYIEEDRSDASKSLIMLYNEETERSIRTRVGRRESGAEIEVIEFRIDRLRDANGNPYTEVFAVINDQRSGKTVTLQNNKRLYLQDFAAELRSDSDSDPQIKLGRVGQAFETSNGKYRLEFVDFEQKSVSVYKFASDKDDAETQRLIVESPEASGSDGQDGPLGTDANAAESLDSLFN